MSAMTWVLAFIAFDLAVIGVIVLVASRKPDSFRVERRAVLKATPEAIYDQINDLAAWQAWSPWAEKDPAAKGTFGPATSGTGAWFAWDGNKNIGKGTMTIIEAARPRHVAMRLDFEKPFKGTNRADFDMQPVDGGTEVTWALSGPSPLLSKIMDLLMNMDRMIGRDFERGLVRLKAVVER